MPCKHQVKECKCSNISLELRGRAPVDIFFVTEFPGRTECKEKKFSTKLYDAGYTTLRDILSIRKKDLLELPGVQDKTASLVYLQIQKTKEATLADYVTASGCFPSTVASTRINKILDTHPDILHYSAAEMKRLVSALPGFSTITTKGFVSGATKPYELS